MGIGRLCTVRMWWVRYGGVEAAVGLLGGTLVVPNREGERGCAVWATGVSGWKESCWRGGERGMSCGGGGCRPAVVQDENLFHWKWRVWI